MAAGDKFPTYFVPASERAAFEAWLHGSYKGGVLGYGGADNLSLAQTKAAYQEWRSMGKPKVGKPRGGGKWGGGALALLLMLDAMRGNAAAPGMDGYISPPQPTFGELVGGLVGAIFDPLGLNELIHGNEIQPNATPKDCPQQQQGDFPPLVPPSGGGYT